MSNKKRIARRLKTDKRSEQIICDVFATTAVVKSKTLGTIQLDETLLKRLAWIVEKAADIQKSWKNNQKKAKSESDSKSLPFSLSEYRRRNIEGGMTVSGADCDNIYLGNLLDKFGLEHTHENTLKVFELVCESVQQTRLGYGRKRIEVEEK